MDFTPAVLRNKGVPVEVAVVQAQASATGTSYERVESDGDCLREVRYVRLTSNELADIEERWGSVDALAGALESKPNSTIRAVLGTVWGVEDRHAGAMMLEGHVDDYSTAVGAAIALANGVDPQQAAEVLRVGATAAGKLREARGELVGALTKQAEESMPTDSPGKPGSAPSPAKAGRSRSSGGSARPKPSS